MRILLLLALHGAAWRAMDAAEPRPVTLLIDGACYEAELHSLGDGQLHLQTASERRVVPLSDLVRWQRPHPVTASPGLLLNDGSFLALLSRANIRALSDEEVTIDSPLWGTVAIPGNGVRAIVVDRPADRWQATRLQDQLTAALRNSDQLWMDNGDRLDGELVSLVDEHVVFRRSGQMLDVHLDRVRAILRGPGRQQTPEAGNRILVGLRDGSLLRARSIEVDDRQLRIRCGPDVLLKSISESAPRGPSAVVLLQPLGGRTVYLSDREPLDYLHLPFLSVRWPYGRDRNVLGDRLSVRNIEYAKGLGMHSTSRLAYRLESQFTRFGAQLAIDDAAEQGGSVVFRVYLDRAGAWEVVYESPIVRGGDPPLACSLELDGASRIALVVDFADRADELDHADWLDARLICDQPHGSTD